MVFVIEGDEVGPDMQLARGNGDMGDGIFAVNTLANISRGAGVGVVRGEGGEDGGVVVDA